MLPSSKIVKEDAKKHLSGKWPLSIAAIMISLFFVFFLLVLFSLLVQFFSGGIPLIILSVSVIFIAALLGFPLTLGVLRLFRYIYEAKDTSLYTAFYYFSSRRLLLKTFKLFILLTSKIALIALLLLLPATITDLLASGRLPFFADSGMPIWFSNLWVFSAFLRGIAAVIFFVTVIRHCPSLYIFIINDDLDCFEIMHLSTKVSKRSAGAFIGLIFSFLGYFLISIFVVPLIFTLPIFIMSYLTHSAAAVELYNKKTVSDDFFENDNKFDL